MILSGLRSVCIVKTTDTVFAECIWINMIGEDGEYNEETVGVDLINGESYPVNRSYSLTFDCYDESIYQDLLALEVAKTKVNLFAFGFDTSIMWREDSYVSVNVMKSNTTGEFQGYTVSVKHKDSGSNIRSSKNILFPTLRTADYLCTGTQVGTSSATTITKQAKSVGFTSATGNVYSVASSGSGDKYATFKEFDNKIPVQAGMQFSVYADCYKVSGTATKIQIELRQFDNTGGYFSSSLSTNITASGVAKGNITIAGGVTYLQFGVTITGNPLTVEFDNLGLYFTDTEVSSFIRG